MFGVVWSRLRNFLYDRQILKITRVPGFIISIGNLTWGGTGKTSLTLELARFFRNQNNRIAIVSRGYRRASKGLRMVSDGRDIRCNWEECGDEAYFLATSLSGVIVVVAEERLQALQFLETYSPDVILLDDAFQHRRVARDVDIVMLDASQNITSQRVIPFGSLREEPYALARADAVVLMHAGQAHPDTNRWVAENVKSRVFHANYVAENADAIRGKKVGAFCGIGAPQHFFRLLEQSGALLVATKSFGDHHRFRPQEIEKFREESFKNHAEIIATTGKDAVRLSPELAGSVFQIIPVKLQIEEESLFYEFLMERFQGHD